MTSTVDQPDFDPRLNMFAFMGMTLSHIQLTEKIINQTLLLVIQESDGLDLDAWEKQTHILDRKTLGQMVVILKNRVGLHEGMEELLTRFLRDRNTLAHDLSRIDGYDLETEQGLAVITAFLRNLFDNSTRVQKIFLAIGNSWQEQVGIVTPFDQSVREYVGDYFLNNSEILFHKKEV